MKRKSLNSDSNPEVNGLTRRHFVKMAGITALGVSSIGISEFYARGVSIVSDPTDLIAASLPAQWALKELEQSLISLGTSVFRCEKPEQSKPGDLCIVAASSDSTFARKILKTEKVTIPEGPEALGIIPFKLDGKQVILASGNDQRGIIYAILELADRVQNSTAPIESLNIIKPVVERPANVIRSINRLFVSDIEDKPWFNDREMWPNYLNMLATNRFNRFNLSFGIGYDSNGCSGL
jgi:hypothetical protein